MSGLRENISFESYAGNKKHTAKKIFKEYLKLKTEFVTKIGEQILAIKDVSTYICENCGEAYYTPEVSRKIDIIMKKFHESKLLLHPVAAGELSFDEILA